MKDRFYHENQFKACFMHLTLLCIEECASLSRQLIEFFLSNNLTIFNNA